MVSLQTAEKALKTVYLGVVAEQLNLGVNPFMAKIQQTSSDVWGKDIVKLVPYGMNGGIGAGTEIGGLPDSGNNNYAQFRLELKNLYGTIELSDKAIRASAHNSGAFVNLLNAEMEGLLKASKFNLGRMLYGDGTGKVASVVTGVVTTKELALSSIKGVAEGMIIDVICGETGLPYQELCGARILSMNRDFKRIALDKEFVTIGDGDYITVQKSKGYELTGLGAIFSNNDLYGLSRAQNNWLKPYTKNNAGVIDSLIVQTAIDSIEENAGSQIDFILTSYDVKRSYLEYLNANRTNVDFMNLDGGYKAMCYNGIPLVADRFVEDGTMYLLNSKDFKLHQLCDWRWLEGDGGNVIKQKAGTATYSATLVKYADLVCDRPIGQAKISGLD